MIRNALVVGINTYKSEQLSTLRTPVKDAEAVAQRLREHGDFHVQLITDSSSSQEDALQSFENRKVTLDQLELSLANLFGLSERGNVPDTALFYFSGHGFRKTTGISEGFLATSDTDFSMGNRGLRLKWLRELLQESPVRQQVIWLDCCNSGELLNYTEADPGDRGNAKARCFIAATEETELAYENSEGDLSVFTASLLEGLKAGASDQWVTNYNLSSFLSERFENFLQKPTFTNIGQPINIVLVQKETFLSSSSDGNFVSSSSRETDADSNSSVSEQKLTKRTLEFKNQANLAMVSDRAIELNTQEIKEMQKADKTELSPVALSSIREHFVNSQSPSAQRTAVRQLARFGRNEPETFNFLKRQAQDSSIESIRQVAIQGLSEYWKDNPETLSILQELASGERTSTVRQVAIQALSENWKDDPVTLLILQETATSDQDESVRKAAIHALSENWKDDPETLDILKDSILNDQSESIRNLAVQALLEDWTEDAFKFASKIMSWRTRLQIVRQISKSPIIRLSDDVSSKFFTFLRDQVKNDRDPDVRVAAMNLLV